MNGNVKWINGFKFEASSESGHSIIMDTAEKSGGTNQGPTPMELVLLALGGCTGMDIIVILKKMRKEIESFEMRLEAERAEDHPRIFTKINVTYILKGKDLKESDIERAIDLSKDKYCSVGGMLNKAAAIDYHIQIAQ